MYMYCFLYVYTLLCMYLSLPTRRILIIETTHTRIRYPRGYCNTAVLVPVVYEYCTSYKYARWIDNPLCAYRKYVSICLKVHPAAAMLMAVYRIIIKSNAI